MLAYRHAFHAGNHGDVLKHLVLARVLAYLNLKPKGWRYVDTHAGAGSYPLTGSFAKKRCEFADGIGRLWGCTDAPPPVADYLAVVRRANAPGQALARYPGSPRIAQSFQRPQDQLRLFELHPSDFRALAGAFAGKDGVQLSLADGFDALRSQLPPPTRRGLVLIDPSYEGERDYAKVLAALRDALRRFAEGIYIVWYPQVSKIGARELPRRLQALAPRGWLHARLSIARPDAQGFGMAGSGVFVINPPHTLHGELQSSLPWLAQVLAQTDHPLWQLDQKAN